MTETSEVRLRRLTMRSARRGTKEMDLILADYAARRLAAMTPAELDLYERLLDEADTELYHWISGQSARPAEYDALLVDIASGAQGLVRPA